MHPLKETVTVKQRRLDSAMLAPSDRPKPTVEIIGRRQTIDEQHRFKAATDALLSELVRQQLGRRS